jgi:predicted N-formylglutamate amidohydrolase
MHALNERPRVAAAEADPPFVAIDGDVMRGLLILCDHASNKIPAGYGDLGLPAEQLARHIAYDPGAAAVAEALARRLGAPAVLSSFSRLFIDPNRGEDDPTLIMRISDRAVIPGNRDVDAVERARRIAGWYAPYHAAIAVAIDRAIAVGRPPALVSIHSFTPVWRGTSRPWDVGVLWDEDPRLAVPLIEGLARGGLMVGDNEPYAGALANDCMYRHGTRRGLAHALIELRQDLIADAVGVAAWADRLAAIIGGLDTDAALHQIRHYGSRTGPVSPL